MPARGGEAVLLESESPLVDAHDLVMFDLDGVVYVSGHAVPGVAGVVARLRTAGRHVAFITNNASRTPEQVAQKLSAMGVEAAPSDVVTSAQAAARLVAARHGPGARVMMLGGAGLAAALADQDVVVAEDGETDVVAVVSGYGPDVRWRDVMKAATLVGRGVPYVATNGDLTVPTRDGLAPGHGMLVRAISGFAGIEPQIAGKPERPLIDETVRRVGGARPLMVGDRLDTDIEGAARAGIRSLLVLTGVTRLPELAAAGPELRPDYISPGSAGLFEPHPAPVAVGSNVALGGWEGTVVDGRLEVRGQGSVGDWWRVAAVTMWTRLDRAGVPVDVSGVQAPDPSQDTPGR